MLPIIVALMAAMILDVLNFPLFRVLNYTLALYLQLIFDISLITVLVYFSGGIESPFYFLYILPIIVASMFLTKRDTIYIAAVSYIIFGILSDLMFLKLIPHPYPSWDINISWGRFVLNLVMGFIAFSTVAFISSYFFEKIRKTGEELKSVQENLKDLILLNNMVLEKMENGFVTCNSKGDVISYNERSKLLLNLNYKSNIFNLLLSKSDYYEVRDLRQTQNRFYFEREIGGLDLGITVSCIENVYSFDKIFVFIIIDQTEKRRIEKELRKKEHLALIGEMSAGIAHEIRNPLASISGSVQFLKKELELEPENQKLMNIIVTESERLSTSIEGFLDFAKTTPLKISEFDLSAMLDEVVDLVGFQKKKVRIIKQYNRKNMIQADQMKMKQVLWNLLNNAIKAIRKRGKIEINIYEEEGNVYLSLKDNGVGMSENELSKVFLPFYSRFTSGVGLGMAIVKRIADEHQFNISVKSEKDVGTEVILCLTKP